MPSPIGKPAVYRFFDIEGRLLYVGSSMSLLSRIYSHTGLPWFDEIDNIKIQHLRSKEDALLAERAAIENEKPLFNLEFTEGRAPRGVTKQAFTPDEVARIDNAIEKCGKLDPTSRDFDLIKSLRSAARGREIGLIEKDRIEANRMAKAKQIRHQESKTTQPMKEPV